MFGWEADQSWRQLPALARSSPVILSPSTLCRGDCGLMLKSLSVLTDQEASPTNSPTEVTAFGTAPRPSNSAFCSSISYASHLLQVLAS